MKILSLTNEEFDFLHKIFTAAHENMDMLKKQMDESPMSKIIALLEEVSGPDVQVSEFKAKVNKDREDLFKNLASLKIKFDHLTVSEQ